MNVWLYVCAIPAMSPHHWETMRLWSDAPFHGVVHIAIRHANEQTVFLEDADRLFVYEQVGGLCNQSVPIGTSFAPLSAADGNPYFETHIFAHAPSLRVCMRLITRGSDSVWQIAGSDPAGFRFVHEQTDVSATGDGVGLPITGRMRVIRTLTEKSVAPTPPTTPPMQPPDAPPPSTPPTVHHVPRYDQCDECFRKGALVNPFCANETSCSTTLIESVIVLFKSILFSHASNAYSLGIHTRLVNKCLSSLHTPKELLTSNDIIEYARYKLLSQVPVNYTCLE